MSHEYEVLKIDELTRVGKTGNLERFVRVRAITIGGTTFSVDIEDPDTTPEKTAPILQKRARDLDAILKL